MVSRSQTQGDLVRKLQQKPKAVLAIAGSTLVVAFATAGPAGAIGDPGTAKGPQTTIDPYVIPIENPTVGGVNITSILSVADKTTGDGTTGYPMAGIPDGLGAYDNGDGTFTLLSNFEIPSGAGQVRGYGQIGSFVGKFTIDKTTLAVPSGSDLVTSAANADYSGGASGPFLRFCSADLSGPNQLYNAASVSGSNPNGNGYNGKLFFQGEENGPNGRGVAHDPVAGTLKVLPALGQSSFENIVLADTRNSDTTFAAMDYDSGAGWPTFYKGTKTNTGTIYDKAGLTSGQLYAAVVPAQTLNSVAYPTVVKDSPGVASGGGLPTAPTGNDFVTIYGKGKAPRFTLAPITAGATSFTVTNKSLTTNVATLTLASTAGLLAGDSVTVAGVDTTFNGTFNITGVTATTITYAKTAADVASAATSGAVTIGTGVALQNAAYSAGALLLDRTEDGAWDPSNPNDYYFVTTGSIPASTPQHGRGGLWRMRYDDRTQPQLGGTLELLTYYGDAAPMYMPDNVTIDNAGHIVILEDPGADNYVARVWAYDINQSQLAPIATFDPARFNPANTATYLTNDEETSGVIPGSNAGLAANTFLFTAQVHTTNTPLSPLADNTLQTFSVASYSLTSNVVTVTTTGTHSIPNGATVTVAGVDPAINGTYTATSVTANTVTFAKTAANIALTSVAAGTIGYPSLKIGGVSTTLASGSNAAPLSNAVENGQFLSMTVDFAKVFRAGGPAAVVPEAPWAILIPLTGLALVGGLYLVRRRSALI
jgi:hypothetical protein